MRKPKQIAAIQTFGLTAKLKFATRPEVRIGTDEMWDKAESSLKAALDATGMDYELKEGDGAFYGPKIDFDVLDSIGRPWQLGTIQLDYGNPERFDLTLTDATGGKVGFRRNLPIDQLQASLPVVLAAAAERQHNVIVRPRSAGATLIQLDDLGEDVATRLRPVSFLILRTSPRSYQAWVAVADGDADFARRLRKGAGADLTASGATSLADGLCFSSRRLSAGRGRSLGRHPPG